MNKAGSVRPAILQSDFASCSGCASRSKTSSNVRKTQASFEAQRTKSLGNDRGKPYGFSGTQLKASLGGSLASLDRHYSEAIDCRPASFLSGLAQARQAPLDLQKIH
jgi:hypothetical protein